jgi:hypothetical protein
MTIPKATLISERKSGRTWLRFMLDHTSMKNQYNYDHCIVKRGNIKFHTIRAKRQRESDTNVIYLYRCPIDTAVSLYWGRKFYRDLDDGDINGYCVKAVRDIVHHHLTFMANTDRYNKVMYMTYEDLQHDTKNQLKRVAEFSGVELTDEEIDYAIEVGKFESMQQYILDEEKRNSIGKKGYELVSKKGLTTDFDNPNGRKVRKGKIGGYVDELEPDTIRKIKEWLDKVDYYNKVNEYITK